MMQQFVIQFCGN